MRAPCEEESRVKAKPGEEIVDKVPVDSAEAIDQQPALVEATVGAGGREDATVLIPRGLEG